MKYSTGDVVRFKIGKDEIQEGEVQAVEENSKEDILYVNSFSGWAYKISDKKVVSRLT